MKNHETPISQPVYVHDKGCQNASENPNIYNYIYIQTTRSLGCTTDLMMTRWLIPEEELNEN